MVGAGARRGASTSSSPATRWPRTTSSPRSTAPRSASTSPRAAASSTATSTTSARSTRSARPARSSARSSDGVLTGGIMHALVTQGKKFVLVGSVRDDGPLPDVYTDVIEGQRAMRASSRDVGFCLMVATMLHSVATGNILPASIPLVCVDINPATVTKLADRGSAPGAAASSPTSGCSSSSSPSSSWRTTAAPEPPTGQVGRADHAGLRAELGARAVGGPDRWAAPTQRASQRVARGLEQQVAGGRHAAADDDHVGVERRDEVRRRRCRASRRRIAKARRATRSPSLGGAVTIGPVTRSGSPPSPRSRTAAARPIRRRGRCGPARCRWSTAPSSRGCRTRRAARRARPACARTPRPCRCAPRKQPPSSTIATADAGAQRDHQRRASAPGRAVAGLGPRRAVGVVLEPDRAAERARRAGPCSGSPRHGRCGANMTRSPAGRRSRPRATPDRRRSALAGRLEDAPRPARPRPGSSARAARASTQCGAQTRPASSTTPASTLVPPMSTPTTTRDVTVMRPRASRPRGRRARRPAWRGPGAGRSRGTPRPPASSELAAADR